MLSGVRNYQECGWKMKILFSLNTYWYTFLKIVFQSPPSKPRKMQDHKPNYEFTLWKKYLGPFKGIHTLLIFLLPTTIAFGKTRIKICFLALPFPPDDTEGSLGGGKEELTNRQAFLLKTYLPYQQLPHALGGNTATAFPCWHDDKPPGSTCSPLHL